MSTASFRFRYLLGLLCHVMLAFSACTVLQASSTPEILSECDNGSSFAESTELKRWMGFPLDVYIDAGSFPESHRDSYRDGVRRGVALWADATENRIGRLTVNFDRPDSPITIALATQPLQDNAIGSTELTFTENIISKATVQLARSHFEGTAFLANDVASTTAHEIGHALGIIDHSPNREDKMWVSGNFGVRNQGNDPLSLLTPRDIHTLQQAYCK